MPGPRDIAYWGIDLAWVSMGKTVCPVVHIINSNTYKENETLEVLEVKELFFFFFLKIKNSFFFFFLLYEPKAFIWNIGIKDNQLLNLRD